MTVRSGDKPLHRGRRSNSFSTERTLPANEPGNKEERKTRTIFFFARTTHNLDTGTRTCLVPLALIFAAVWSFLSFSRTSTCTAPSRVVFLDRRPLRHLKMPSSTTTMSWDLPTHKEKDSSDHLPKALSCPDIADWQRITSPHPTCNLIHEVSPPLEWIDSGAFKDVWRVNDEVVLKTPVIHFDFGPSNLARHQTDALVMHETTTSPYVLNMYSYCAYSSIVEAAQCTLQDWLKDQVNVSPLTLLRAATHMAQGLADIHLYTNGLPTFAHTDLKASQFLVLSQPRDPNHPILKLNDFNRGRLLSATNNTICPFFVRSKHRGSTNRSPEEYLEKAPQTDKIDVFSLGSTLYELITGAPPFDDLEYADAIENILNGVQPPPPNVTDPRLLTLMNIIIKCRRFRPDDRPTSKQVAKWLTDALYPHLTNAHA